MTLTFAVSPQTTDYTPVLIWLLNNFMLRKVCVRVRVLMHVCVHVVTVLNLSANGIIRPSLSSLR